MSFNVLISAMSATSILGCNKPFEFLKFNRNDIDDLGRDVLTFDEPVIYHGSIQAVPNKMYEQLGLDLSKNYKIVYCPKTIKGLSEATHPDRIIYDGKTYDVVENKNWSETNGYTKALMVEIKSLRDDNCQI